MQHQQSSSSKLTNYLLDYADFSLTNRQLMYHIQMSIDFGLTDQATNQIETGKGEEPLRQSHTEKSPVTPGEKEVTTVTPVQKEVTPLQMESSVVTPMRGGQKKASTVTPVQMESSAVPRVRTAQKEVSPTTQVKVESSPVAAAQKNTLPVIVGQVEMGYYVLPT